MPQSDEQQEGQLVIDRRDPSICLTDSLCLLSCSQVLAARFVSPQHRAKGSPLYPPYPR